MRILIPDSQPQSEREGYRIRRHNLVLVNLAHTRSAKGYRHPCRSADRPCCTSSSALRIFAVTSPVLPSATEKSPLSDLTCPMGVTTAAVPQANTSAMAPLWQPAFHSSNVMWHSSAA